jgi:hypothetical protein
MSLRDKHSCAKLVSEHWLRVEEEMRRQDIRATGPLLQISLIVTGGNSLKRNDPLLAERR